MADVKVVKLIGAPRGIGLQVALRQVQNLLESGETAIFVTTTNGKDPEVHGLARVTDPRTSQAAGPEEDKLEMLRKNLRALVKYGPQASFRLAELMGIDRSRVSNRLCQLREDYDPPLVRWTGNEIINPNYKRKYKSGEQGATEFGIALAAMSERDFKIAIAKAKKEKSE